ncbi:lysis system i-spanin subunit Rz [Pantoea agglomerans]|uniref:lysis system i-spanin subunit Rz n=1 Tax=Enterobacter agglomerans TaxID=549 RepID=UPI0024138F91|nr:lysis system i-spanin subunit Rz [Pantoea agglomerans]
MNIRTCLAGGLLVAVLLLGWAADHYHDKAIAWRTTAQQSQQLARQQAATITDINQRQQRLAAIDKTHTEALSAAESENDAFRRQLAVGTRRMYVHAKCPVSGAGAASGSGGMGDATAVELTADSRRNILDIRAGIIRDREKLKYLQDYVRTQCLR